MQHFSSPYLFAALSCLLALLALYLGLALRRITAKNARLKKYLVKLKDAERALRKSAFLDPLTGLANRLLLMDRFEVAMRHARRSRKKFAVLMLDLNKFKAINDTYGHAAGDQVLVTVAQRLVSIVRESDTVSQKVVLNSGDTVAVGTSVGYAWYPKDGHNLHDVLEVADQAMYTCKTSGLMPLA
jgi:GGDEF domain-containing protein